MTMSMLMALLMIAMALFLIALWVIRSIMRGRLRHARMRAPQIGGLPPMPATLGSPVIPATTGRYIGSNFAPRRLDRVAAGDLEDFERAVLTRYPEGIMLERSGSRPIWVPGDSITSIRTEDEMLTIRWKLPSGMEVETGFRADDDRTYAGWLEESDSE